MDVAQGSDPGALAMAITSRAREHILTYVSQSRAMYRFDHDCDTNVLHITAVGFWSVPTATAFCLAAVAKGGSIRLRHGDFAIVADARGCPIQSGPVAELLHHLLPKARLLSNGPIALIAAGMLNKLQIDRLFSGEAIRSFLDYDQAMAWIGHEWIARRAA